LSQLELLEYVAVSRGFREPQFVIPRYSANCIYFCSILKQLASFVLTNLDQSVRGICYQPNITIILGIDVTQFIEACFSWPSFPATLLLLVVCGYWMLVMVGAMSIEILDFDLDFDLDVDADASILQIGFVPLKWLNLGSVPTMLWISVFSFSAWVVSRLIDSPDPHAVFDWASDSRALIRDFGIAVFITKCVTQPLRGRFDPVEPNTIDQLIGSTCTVSTSQVTETFGEAVYATEGAPLKLMVRTIEGSLSKGDEAKIVDVLADKNIYIVQPIESATNS
jgi:hypothetical protein